jgi:hypothetical protein
VVEYEYPGVDVRTIPCGICGDFIQIAKFADHIIVCLTKAMEEK